MNPFPTRLEVRVCVRRVAAFEAGADELWVMGSDLRQSVSVQC